MKLNQIFNIAILVACLSAALWWGFSQRRDKLTYRDNWKAEKHYLDQERIVTSREMSELYKESTVLQKRLGLKPKQVERLVQGEISFRDTGRTKEIFIPADTVFIYPDSISGVITSDCYNIDILLYKAIFTAKLDYKDTLSLMMYRERPHKFLFVKYGRWRHRATLYSGCRDSVYKVFNNLNIQGKR